MFQNRQAAGKLIAARLREYQNSQESIVVALPRGGVVVGSEIAKSLSLPMEAISVKKLGAPNNPELAIGSVAQGKVKYLDWEMIKVLGIPGDYLEREQNEKNKEVDQRIINYQIKPDYLLNFTNFILTDDGIATGATIRAAILALRNLKRADIKKFNIILAVPVAAGEVFDQLREEVEKAVVIEKANNFGALGQFYSEFEQVGDREVIKILNEFRRKG